MPKATSLIDMRFPLQKVNRRLHLSKSKNTKFNESGQLCVFHLVSSVWSLYILVTVRTCSMLSTPHYHCQSDSTVSLLSKWLHCLTIAKVNSLLSYIFCQIILLPPTIYTNLNVSSLYYFPPCHPWTEGSSFFLVLLGAGEFAYPVV